MNRRGTMRISLVGWVPFMGALMGLSGCGGAPLESPSSPIASFDGFASGLAGPIFVSKAVEDAGPRPVETPIEVADEAPAIEELNADEAVSGSLRCGLANPMPGGVMAGYLGDTGLDIAGAPRDVYAIASGMLEYAEAGHTLWNGRTDSPFALRIRLDEPIVFGERKITHVWYAHLSELAREMHEGSGEEIHVSAGRRLGKSGMANGCNHLHIGLLLDGEVEQYWGTYLLENDVRKVLCNWTAGTRLPGDEPTRT